MEKVIVFGASRGGTRAFRHLPRRTRVVAFCDNDHAKQGCKFEGRPVISPDRLPDTDFDYILVASSYYPEIFNQLLAIGIPLDRIEVLDAEILRGEAEEERPLLFFFGALLAAPVLLMLLLSTLIWERR